MLVYSIHDSNNSNNDWFLFKLLSKPCGCLSPEAPTFGQSRCNRYRLRGRMPLSLPGNIRTSRGDVASPRECQSTDRRECQSTDRRGCQSTEREVVAAPENARAPREKRELRQRLVGCVAFASSLMLPFAFCSAVHLRGRRRPGGGADGRVSGRGRML